MAERVLCSGCDALIHGDEPLRGGAEDHRLLRPPGMGIVVLVAGAGEKRIGLDQRLDHRLIGIAELALVVDDALAFEARRLFGEEAVGIDGEGDRGVDAARFECGAIFLPDLEVLGAVAGRGVHEARAGVLGDVLAGEQRHAEVVAVAAKGMSRSDGFESSPRHVAVASPGRHARRLENVFGELVGKDQPVADFAQLSSGACVTS